MKKLIVVLSAVAVIVIGQMAYAFGPGNCNMAGQGFGAGFGAGIAQQPYQPICSGSTETVTGVVTGTWVPGAGLAVTVDGVERSFYGLGPIWYWDANSIDRPEIGETVTITASGVTVSDRKVILSVTIGSQTIQLRDSATCLPLWRGQRGR